MLLRADIPISLLFFISGVTGVLPACAELPIQSGAGVPRPETTRSSLRPAQIIIKFRDPAADPSRPEFLEEINRDLGAALVYVRPMSGAAHVLRLEKPAEGAELDRIIRKLETRRDVEYVEPDRPMRHMRGTMQ